MISETSRQKSNWRARARRYLQLIDFELFYGKT
jgi:hypothetical protein